MTEPTCTTERFLEALGAEPEFRDALVGDLCEERALRVAWDGERAARRWYRREALRVAPHLLRAGVRRLGWRGARRVARAAMTSYLCACLVHLVLAGTVQRAVQLLSGDAGAEMGPWTLQLSWTHPFRGLATLTLLLALTALPPMVSGFVAASVEDDAPVFPVLAVGAMQLGALAAQLGIGYPGPTGPVWGVPGPAVPTWVVACQCLLVAVGPVVGGALRVSERVRPAAHHSPSRA
jgi:hypothetical protein